MRRPCAAQKLQFPSFLCNVFSLAGAYKKFHSKSAFQGATMTKKRGEMGMVEQVSFPFEVTEKGLLKTQADCVRQIKHAQPRLRTILSYTLAVCSVFFILAYLSFVRLHYSFNAPLALSSAVIVAMILLICLQWLQSSIARANLQVQALLKQAEQYQYVGAEKTRLLLERLEEYDHPFSNHLSRLQRPLIQAEAEAIENFLLNH